MDHSHSIVRVKNPSKQRTILGRNIARLRTAKGYTQERLAESSNIHPRYMQRVEYGMVSVSLEVFLRIHRALGCQWQELLHGIE